MYMLNCWWISHGYILKREIFIKRYISIGMLGDEEQRLNFEWRCVCSIVSYCVGEVQAQHANLLSVNCIHDDAGPNSIHIQPSASTILYTLGTMATMMKQWNCCNIIFLEIFKQLIVPPFPHPSFGVHSSLAWMYEMMASNRGYISYDSSIGI